MLARLDHWLVLATWGCIVTLTVLSLLPGEDMIRTGLAGQLEHFIAYAGSGAIASFAYRDRVPAWRIAAGFAGLATLLEIGQNFSPGRHPAVIDATAGALGACAGILVARVAARWIVPALGDRPAAGRRTAGV